MTSYRLGINTCFAVKRWPQPERWARLVRDELGLDLVQHTLDLADLDNSPGDITDQADWLRAACTAGGLTLHSTITGQAAYTSNLLLHPDPAARDRARAWYRRVIDFTAAAGGGATGGYLGAYSIDDWQNPVRRAKLWSDLGESLAELAGYAREQGLSCLMAENQAGGREPSTLAMLSSLLTDGDDAHVPVTLCLDAGHQRGPGTSGKDRDAQAWLRQLGARTTVVQLRPPAGAAGQRRPSMARTGAAACADADRLLAALDTARAADVALILEVIPPVEQDDGEALEQLRKSAGSWQEALAEHDRGR